MNRVNENFVPESGISAWNIFKSVGLAYLTTLLIFLVLAVALANTEFPETLIASSVVITTLISIMIAGTVAARKARSKGWLNGGIAGFIYMLILYLISSFTTIGFKIDQYVVVMLIAGIIAGAFGGIVGINLRKQ